MSIAGLRIHCLNMRRLSTHTWRQGGERAVRRGRPPYGAGIDQFVLLVLMHL